MSFLPTSAITPGPGQHQTLGPRLYIGDAVTLPEGQHAIIRYIGPVNGKNGDFVGVELIDNFSHLGRHNGEFEG